MNLKKYSFIFTAGLIIIIFMILTPFLCSVKYSIAKYVSIYPDTSSRNYFNVRDTTFNFIMQLRIHEVGRGNVHTMDCSKWEKDHSTWIYIKQRTGKLDTSQFILTNVYGRSDYPWAEKSVHGSIELTADSVDINIEIPQNKEGQVIQNWSPYGWNGKYPLKEEFIISPADKWTI